MIVIDCVSPPPVAAMRAAGVTGLSRYLSWADKRDTLHKVIHRPEYDALRADGFDVLLNWEYSARDWMGGASAGKAHAAEAVRQAKALGYPVGCAIPGSADFNMTSAEWGSAGRAYAQAYAAGIKAGGYIAGVYGPWDVLTWCQQLGGFGMFWQSMSTAWSGGRNAKLWPGAHLRQRRQTYIGGVDCDINDVIQADYGQHTASQEEIVAVLLNITLPDGKNQTGVTDGLGGWRWVRDLDALAEAEGAFGTTIRQVTVDMARRAYGIPMADDGTVTPPEAPVAITDEQLDALAQKVAASMPKPPTAAETAKAVNDDAAARLQS